MPLICEALQRLTLKLGAQSASSRSRLHPKRRNARREFRSTRYVVFNGRDRPGETTVILRDKCEGKGGVPARAPQRLDHGLVRQA